MRDEPSSPLGACVRDGILEITLPSSLVLLNRTALIDAIDRNLLRPGVRALRLDARALEHVDSAGLGALARVVRACMDATGTLPMLAGAREEVQSAMRSVLLLRYFVLVGIPDEGEAEGTA